MNTFAILLLAFPLYLATKGRLIAYTTLATSAPAANAAATGDSTLGLIQPVTPIS